MPAPLLVTCDSDLLDDLLRLAAAAGVTLDVAHDPGSALRLWSAAPLVLVGPDLVGLVADQAPPRRPEVFLLSHGEPDYRAAVAVGAADVVQLPLGEAWLGEALADAGEGGRASALTLGIVGGSGGVGATTLACATGLSATGRGRVALLDLDPLGAGVERVLGLDDIGGVRWSDLAASRGRLGSQALRDSLPERDGLAVLGWGSVPDAPDLTAVREVLTAAQRGHELLVADLPRHLDEPAALVASRCDHVLLVASCSLPGAAAAVRALAALSSVVGSVQLVARTSGGAVTASALASALGLPLVAEVGEQRRLAEQLDLGLGPLHSRRGPVARAAREILRRLAPGVTVAA